MLRAEDNVIPIGFPKDGRRPRRMRARRHRIADLKIGEIRARLFHFELGEVAAVAEDVSLHGLAIAVPHSDEEQRVVLIISTRARRPFDASRSGMASAFSGSSSTHRESISAASIGTADASNSPSVGTR